jgi:hypothetical protein
MLSYTFAKSSFGQHNPIEVKIVHSVTSTIAATNVRKGPFLNCLSTRFQSQAHCSLAR